MGYTTIIYRSGAREYVYVSDYNTEASALKDFEEYMDILENKEWTILKVMTPKDKKKGG